MNATQQLHDLGQSLWLDNITRDVLNRGTLKRYTAELSVTELNSNPTTSDHAITNSTVYAAAMTASGFNICPMNRPLTPPMRAERRTRDGSSPPWVGCRSVHEKGSFC